MCDYQLLLLSKFKSKRICTIELSVIFMHYLLLQNFEPCLKVFITSYNDWNGTTSKNGASWWATGTSHYKSLYHWCTENICFPNCGDLKPFDTWRLSQHFSCRIVIRKTSLSTPKPGRNQHFPLTAKLNRPYTFVLPHELTPPSSSFPMIISLPVLNYHFSPMSPIIHHLALLLLHSRQHTAQTSLQD